LEGSGLEGVVFSGAVIWVGGEEASGDAEGAWVEGSPVERD